MVRRITKWVFILSAICLAAGFNNLYSQDIQNHRKIKPADSVEFVLQEVVITAGREAYNQFRLPGAITSLNKIDLQKANIRSTPELLAGKCGVWVQKTNHGGGSPYIRGLTGYHTLLLVDGIRLNNGIFRSGPNQYLNTIDPFMLSAIEVLRGDGAVQYGSDAVGGVVNLISYQPSFSENTFHVRGQLGMKYVIPCLSNSDETSRVTLYPGMEGILHGRIESSSNKICMVAAGSLKQFGDIMPGGNGQSLSPTGYDEYDLGYTISLKPDENNTLTAAFQHMNQSDIPIYHKLVSSGYNTYHTALQQRTLYRLSDEIDLKGMVEKVTINTFLIRARENLAVEKSGSPNHSLNKDQILTRGFTLDVRMKKRGITFHPGIDFYHDRVESEKIIYNEQDQITEKQRGTFADGSMAWHASLFALCNAEMGLSRFNLGTRLVYSVTQVSDTLFGRVTLKDPGLVWNLGYSLSVTPRLKWVFSLNSGYRTPNISDLSSFGIADYRFEIPNTSLGSEKSLTAETGFKISTPKVGSSFFVYYTGLKNLISTKPTSYQGNDSVSTDGTNYVYYYTRINMQQSAISGAEIQFLYRYTPKFQLNVMACYTYGQNNTLHEPVSRIPPLNASAVLSYHHSRQLGASLEWLVAGKQDRLSSGDRKDSRIPSGGTPSWSNLSVSLHLISKYIDVHAGVGNVLNARYRTHGSGVDAYGRHIWLHTIVKLP
ncbi:MAG: TonB-dependent receptor [Bacteroidales bacterium]